MAQLYHHIFNISNKWPLSKKLQESRWKLIKCICDFYPGISLVVPRRGEMKCNVVVGGSWFCGTFLKPPLIVFRNVWLTRSDKLTLSPWKSKGWSKIYGYKITELSTSKAIFIMKEILRLHYFVTRSSFWLLYLFYNC